VPTLSADEVVHTLIAEDPQVRAALERRFGTTDRTEIAAIVFSDHDELAWLEGLLHPRVRRAEEEWLADLDAPLAVVEIPLLYETGGDARFDVVVAITAPAEVRAARGGALDARERRLLPDELKAERADFAYVNDGTLADLDAFVGDVLERLRGRLAEGTVPGTKA
jgi:dephospho-CoA kinase